MWGAAVLDAGLPETVPQCVEERAVRWGLDLPAVELERYGGAAQLKLFPQPQDREMLGFSIVKPLSIRPSL